MNSYAVKEHVSKYEHVPVEKIDVIQNGIDFVLFVKKHDKERFIKESGISNGDYVVGTVANLNRLVKRVDVFLQAASEVLQTIPNVSFVVVGDGYLRDELEGIAEQLGISEKVFFLGRRNDVSSIIANWDIGVVSSDSEGFSNMILEYMASGLPVVATAVGGNKEVIEQGVTGVLVAPGDYKSMAEKICTLLKDRKRRLQIGEKGTSIVQEEYAWDVKIKEIENYYQAIADIKIKA